MSEVAQALAALVSERLDSRIERCEVHAGQVTAVVPASSLVETCLVLRDDSDLDFAQLVDLCGVDYSEYGVADWETSESASTSGFSRGVEDDVYREPREGLPRFAVVCQLLSLSHNRRLRLRVAAEGEPPRVDSLIDVWASANWFEREAFDLYGILFVGHPDLRRILTDYGFIGHPFRKDFPLIGEVEMRYDPERRRVVYEPVSIEPRVLVPRVIRHDERYAEQIAHNMMNPARSTEGENA
ncbi:MAG: NADH-quinone oxidoreductase subunit C [Gammaproteobacteria bacterium]|nr:NADH-quinone oxidoreductase subunit C [Gammaproteobacteria bacterium]